ncbi:glycosyltransferase family 4 protein [Candidatus Woesebacteria bacterium]|nr:glycosyltransferase family 4 protein [Candidatus Woesebacteria bacterium]
MKAGIYSPYLDTLGGGERYLAGVIAALTLRGYEVDVEWPDASIKKKLEERFNVKLKCNIVPSIERGDNYDVCFWVSDGSIPALKARRNMLHFQVPFHGTHGRSLINKMKLWRVTCVCNSQFTKSIIDKEYGVDSVVIYPPIDTESFKPKKKTRMILYVGRFSNLMQSKRQDVLIDAFKKIKVSYPEWKLVLAGGEEVGAEQEVARLTALARGVEIEIVQSPSFSQIKDLYGKATIFWSAAGFEVDANKYPEKMEHFGMSVVEGMSAGALPIVFNGGGFKEIVSHGKTGILWDTKDELIRFTKSIIKEKEYLEKIALAAQERAQTFSYSAFNEHLNALLQ